MKSSFISLFAILTLSNFLPIRATSQSCYGETTENILNNINPKLKPDVEGLKVGFSLSLIDIASEEKGVFSFVAWPMMNWTDPRLERTSGKLQEIHVPIDDIWLPDIVSYNLLDTDKYLIKPLAIVYSTGSVLFIPSKRYVVRCHEDKNRQYVCSITFGSWTYSSKDINLLLNSDQLDLEYYENKDFQVVSSNVVRTEKKYPCCPELYVNLKYTFNLKRKV